MSVPSFLFLDCELLFDQVCFTNYFGLICKTAMTSTHEHFEHNFNLSRPVQYMFFVVVLKTYD